MLQLSAGENTDGQTDSQTDGRTDRQTPCDIYRAYA